MPRGWEREALSTKKKSNGLTVVSSWERDEKATLLAIPVMIVSDIPQKCYI
jgi:hypothetical protein